MFPQLIKTTLKSIKKSLLSRPETFVYILMSWGIVFLMSAVGRSQEELDAYVCVSSFVSLLFLMTAFIVAIWNLEDRPG
jgi:hypothetical protein